jgi:hypothetical protein
MVNTRVSRQIVKNASPKVKGRCQDGLERAPVQLPMAKHTDVKMEWIQYQSQGRRRTHRSHGRLGGMPIQGPMANTRMAKTYQREHRYKDRCRTHGCRYGLERTPSKGSVTNTRLTANVKTESIKRQPVGRWLTHECQGGLREGQSGGRRIGQESHCRGR